MWQLLTIQRTISYEVVELHGPIVDDAQLSEHSVDVEHVDKQPGKGGDVEVVKADRHQLAEQLMRDE